MDNVDILASKLQSFITEKDSRKPKPYDTSATVTRVDGDTLWVHIPGGVEETPVKKTINAIPGDSVRVHVENGGAWTIGNSSAPPTDDRQANIATNIANTAQDTAINAQLEALNAKLAAEQAKADAEVAHIAAEEAKTDAATARTAANEAKQDAADAETAAGEAKTAATEAKTDAATAKTDAASAKTAANEAKADAAAANTAANEAKTSATEAKAQASEAKTAADQAKKDASDAHKAANDALTELSTVEDVVGTVTWAAEHSGQDMADYINSHLALTPYGLDLVLDNTSYRIHIGTHTADGDDGVYVIDDQGHVVSFFGENIEFDSGRAQYIGNNNAYIVFDPTGNDGQGSLIIGGSSIQMGTKSLEEILGKTLIYDHTYEYVRDSDNKPIQAVFTAFLYRGGIDVKSEFPESDFTWYLKKEEKGTGAIVEELKGTGYTFTINLSECGYGAEIIGKFTVADNANALTANSDNLTTANNEPLTVRASGESVRVRDLSTSSTIFPTDKLMIVGGEDEHLVSIQTLQDYLNANLNKQVIFDTTAGWSSQTSLVSKKDTLYVYTDHQTDSHGNKVAGIKAGDGLAYVVDLPFTDAILTEHIADNVRHVTQTERDFWNNKVRCYYAGTEQLIFTTA